MCADVCTSSDFLTHRHARAFRQGKQSGGFALRRTAAVVSERHGGQVVRHPQTASSIYVPEQKVGSNREKPEPEPGKRPACNRPGYEPVRPPGAVRTCMGAGGGGMNKNKTTWEEVNSSTTRLPCSLWLDKMINIFNSYWTGLDQRSNCEPLNREPHRFDYWSGLNNYVSNTGNGDKLVCMRLGSVHWNLWYFWKKHYWRWIPGCCFVDR